MDEGHRCGMGAGTIDAEVAATAHRSLRKELPSWHPLATLLDEHAHILQVLKLMEALLEPTDPPEEANRARLEQHVRFLISIEPHHAREEQVLFPALRAAGVHGPTEAMESEHVQLRAMKHRVLEGVLPKEDCGSGGCACWGETRRVALALVEDLRNHIAKEDLILYPLALRVLTGESRWRDLRVRCDEIGYCCAAPPSAP